MTKYLKKAETDRKSRNDRKKTEKPSKSRIFLLKAEEVAALGISIKIESLRNQFMSALEKLFENSDE
jgi:hypothetical protein